METTKITVDTVIGATKEKVWEFWTKPERVTKWNFANDAWHCPTAKNDLKVGGKNSARMEAKDRSFGFDFEAFYDEVVDQKKIVFTMGDGRQAVTIFEDLAGSTKVTTTFDAESENSVEMQKSGWQAILDSFKTYTESQ